MRPRHSLVHGREDQSLDKLIEVFVKNKPWTDASTRKFWKKNRLNWRTVDEKLKPTIRFTQMRHQPKQWSYTRKNSSGWCNIVRWTMPKQCCYQGSTTLVELIMLMSIVRAIVVRCWQRTIIATMLLEQEPTIVDGKSLLIVVNNDWTMVVDRSCWLAAAQHCWQGGAQHCNTLLTTLIELFIFARVKGSMGGASD